MKIRWLGHSSFKLTESTGVSVVTDPFDGEELGIPFPEISAEIVTISHDHFDHNNAIGVKDYKLVINTIGMHEVEGVDISGFLSYHDLQKGDNRGKNIVFRYRMDGVEVCHLGDIGEKLSPMLAELIGSINVLLIPIGGKYTIDADTAKEYTDYLMPDIVIPMHYMQEGYNTELDELDDFLRKFDRNDIEYLDTDEVEFDRLDFDGQKTRVIVLNRAE